MLIFSARINCLLKVTAASKHGPDWRWVNPQGGIFRKLGVSQSRTGEGVAGFRQKPDWGWTGRGIEVGNTSVPYFKRDPG